MSLTITTEGTVIHSGKAIEKLNGDSSDAEDDDWDDDYWWAPDGPQPRPGTNNNSGNLGGSTVTESRQAYLQRLQSRVNFEPLQHGNTIIGHAAHNDEVRSEKKASEARNLGLTRDTRATVEQALDPRTMLVLSKFLKRGVFDRIHGCISTGKEANVYYAVAADGAERALKVYKTSILVFKDRARYVEGEHRFRHGFCKGNPRKMVEQWAEKEMRNLKRLQTIGIACPEVFELRQNVLVMKFIGEDGNAAPRLKDTVGLDPQDWRRLYMDCVLAMRKMFQLCKLVHGDLSEYNILYDDGKLTIIDVSQSVETDHPHALDFLKRDCVNVNNFFAKRMEGAAIPVKRFFDYVVTRDLRRPDGSGVYSVDESSEALEVLLADTEDGAVADADDDIFVQTWIPSNLEQINDRAFIEREIDRRQRGEEVLYERLLAPSAKGPTKSKEEGGADDSEEAHRNHAAEEVPEHQACEDSGNASEDDSGSEGNGEEDKSKEKDGHIPEGMDKHIWKQMVKEQKREKRKDKIPKATKKKYEKVAARGRKK
mmetsp:Transcript_72947/g.144559  ORF Transcript_72947/g.144559 Transcript_72947/m.144559 type:complete len:539 (-) Transcript_72947:99-1715(-)